MTRRAALIIVCAAAILMAPALVTGGIRGDSGFLNTVWADGFANQLLGGVPYPRWLPEMSLGAGSAVFYFYAPLPFFLMAPIHLVTDGIAATTLGSGLLLALSGLAFHALASAFVRPNAAIASAVVYMAMPYHLMTDVWIRATIGEQAAYIFIPLALLCAGRLDQGWRWALWLAAAHAGLLLSHLPSALLFSPFLFGYCLLTALRGDAAAVGLRAASAVFLSFGLAAAYVLPAMTLQGMIHADLWGMFRPENSFLFNSAVKSAPPRLEFSALLSLVLSGIGALYAAAGRRLRPTLPWLAICVAAFLLTTPLSARIWELSPLFDRIQFPWRALVLCEVATCMIIAMTVDTPRWSRKIITLSAGALGVSLYMSASPGMPPIWQRSPATEALLIRDRADAAEYLPRCRVLTAKDEVFGTSSVPIVRKTMAHRPEGTLPVFYYPFLEVTVDGKPITPKCDPKTGLIVANAPPGARVEISKRTLPVEWAANLISLASLIGLVAALLVLRARERGDPRNAVPPRPGSTSRPAGVRRGA